MRSWDSGDFPLVEQQADGLKNELIPRKETSLWMVSETADTAEEVQQGAPEQEPEVPISVTADRILVEEGTQQETAEEELTSFAKVKA